MEHCAQDESRERILKSAVRLFSERGFDGTRVSEIADAAQVNKALIYYYFKSKESILDHLLQELFAEWSRYCMSFVRENIVQMITDGRLDIMTDRFQFIDEEAMNSFMGSTRGYLEWMIDYVLERRDMFRILMLESLKNGKHQHSLFQFLDLIEASDRNPLFKVIKDADQDLDLNTCYTLRKFFFGVIPFISFAAYFDSWKQRQPISDQELRDAFLRSTRSLLTDSIGKDFILLPV